MTGALDRAALRAAVLGKPEALTKLERILHPMVREEERAFLARARRAAKPAAVLDIPLLFETGGRKLSFSVVVSAPRTVQVHRVRMRRKMSDKDIENVIARQMPDAEKRRRADIVVRTGLSRHYTQLAMRRIIRSVRP